MRTNRFKLDLGGPHFLKENRFGIKLLDVYCLNYCGILVFFQVCDLKEDSVYVYELATKRMKDGIALCKGIKPSRKPYIVTKDNCFTRSNCEIYPVEMEGNVYLPIEVDFTSRLYQEAISRGEPAIAGTAYAERVREYANIIWTLPDATSAEVYMA